MQRQSKRRCPNCQSPLPIGSGVLFDDDDNVLCGKCGKPVVAATAEAEQKITGKTTSATPNYGGVGYYGPHIQRQPSQRTKPDYQSPPWSECDRYCMDSVRRLPDAFM